MAGLNVHALTALIIVAASGPLPGGINLADSTVPVAETTTSTSTVGFEVAPPAFDADLGAGRISLGGTTSGSAAE